MLDFIIKDGLIVDGSGTKPFKADIGIKGKFIKVIKEYDGRKGRRRGKDGIEEEAREIINAKGLVVCPGFIDIHTHSDFPILLNPQAENRIYQGITTDVIGNCGTSAFPMNSPWTERLEEMMRITYKSSLDWSDMKSYIKLLRERKPSINIVPLIGHHNIRGSVVGFENREATAKELSMMKDLLEENLANGAFGMSTGLIYAPSMFATTDELIKLASVIKKYNGVYASHIRGESNTVVSAVKEAIEIAKKTKVSVEISHHKVTGRKNFGKVNITLAMIREARLEGYNVNCDVYPYNFSKSNSRIILPPWANEGTMSEIIKRLRNEKIRKKIKEEVNSVDSSWDNPVESAGWKNIIISRVNWARNKKYEGLSIFKAARIERKTPAEFIMDLIINEGFFQDIIMKEMRERDVINVIKAPFSMIGSDGMVFVPNIDSDRVHPRYFGTFPRVLYKYVKLLKVLRLEEAIKKMTSMPAEKLGLEKRGLLRQGYYADITIINYKKIKDLATIMKPTRKPRGIEYVFVNGELVLQKGEITRSRPGEVLLKKRTREKREKEKDKEKGKEKDKRKEK